MVDFDTEAFIDGYIEAALWADASPLEVCECGHLETVHDGEAGCETCEDEGADFNHLYKRDENQETGGLNQTHELDDAGRAKMTPDCERFVKENEADLLLYVEHIQPTIDAYGGSDDRRPESWAGHDFWLTRGGHGTGFWDRFPSPIPEMLADGPREVGMDVEAVNAERQPLHDLGERLSDAARTYGEPDGHTPYAIDEETATA